MSQFWLDSPESLIFINFTTFDGILNILSLIVVIVTIFLIYIKTPNALNIGMVALIIIIILSKCINTENFENINNFIQSPFVDRTERINLESEFIPADLEPTKPCKPATKNNPFGNPNLTDFGVKQKYSNICDDFETKEIQDDVLNDGIFMDSNNYIWRKNQQRQWFSVAGGTVPNDQSAFANWCFNDNNNCKAGNIFMKNPELATDYLKSCTPDLASPQSIAYAAAQPDEVYSTLYPSQGGAKFVE